MSIYIPIVSQDEEPTMVVRPSVPVPPPVPQSRKSSPKQVGLWGNPIRSKPTATVQVQAHTRRDGTRVAAHTRIVKSNKSSKSAKSPKPGNNTKNGAPKCNKPKRSFFPPSLAAADPETAKLIKSMLIQDKLDMVQGKL